MCSNMHSAVLKGWFCFVISVVFKKSNLCNSREDYITAESSVHAEGRLKRVSTDRERKRETNIKRKREKQSFSGELWSYWNNQAQKQSFNFTVKCHSYNSPFHDYCQLTLQNGARANGKLKSIDSPNTMFWYLNYLSNNAAWAKPKYYSWQPETM